MIDYQVLGPIINDATSIVAVTLQVNRVGCLLTPFSEENVWGISRRILPAEFHSCHQPAVSEH